MGYEVISDLTSATGITKPDVAVNMFIAIPTAAVRYRDDGTSPTSAAGMPLLANQSLEYDANISAVEFIQSNGSAALHICYYRST